MRFVRLAVAAASFMALQALAQTDEVMLNFVNADIESVVKAVGEISGRNFVIDPRVKGTVNIVSSRPVPRAFAYQILLSSLRLQGYTAVDGQGVTKILPEADAKLHAGARTRSAGANQLVTKVFRLKHGNASQLVPVIRPLVSPNNPVAAFPQANALIVTDYADNLRRIEAIVESVEAGASDDLAVLPVQFASAVELATLMSKLMQETGGAGTEGGKLSILPDSRANALLVRADTPGKLAKVKSLLRTLDVPSQAGSNVRVVYLKNAEAVKVAATLRALLGQEGGSARAAASVGSAGGAAASAATASATSSSDSGDLAGSPIQADPANNAIIVNAPDAMYQNLRNVIDLLDRRRAQVYVEALIVELSAERAAELGVQWQGLSGFGKGGTQVIGGTNFPNTGNPGIISTSISPGVLAGSSGLNVGILNGTVNIPGLGTITNLGFLARALERTAEGNVLSTPNLMTLDNEEARIVIGQNVPFLTGQFSNTGGGTTPTSPFQTFERRDVGITLKLTPQISEGGLVRLKIFQEASSVDEASRNNPAGLTTNKRSIETSVQVDDGNIVAIGGLIQDTSSDGVDQVPLLGDIPGLGWLFKFQKKTRKKTNLMVFLRPVIMRDGGSAERLAGDRYDYLLGERRQQATKKLELAAPYSINGDSAIESELARRAGAPR
ncbi:type II secretion system secretin GspD [Crenobacter cavernae]|uniref:Type II secretion system protein GspD n=1 Tax=Crenobacter cavernae TaxID=2290923 RepID=A0A345Y9H5_9NEIS|nr:type II secretion system secretin GspD [Crenobacter cavernae]AXK40577.1 type II secretion system protein GspD [Crenobacter cavernae]